MGTDRQYPSGISPETEAAYERGEMDGPAWVPKSNTPASRVEEIIWKAQRGEITQDRARELLSAPPPPAKWDDILLWKQMNGWADADPKWLAFRDKLVAKSGFRIHVSAPPTELRFCRCGQRLALDNCSGICAVCRMAEQAPAGTVTEDVGPGEAKTDWRATARGFVQQALVQAASGRRLSEVELALAILHDLDAVRP